MGVFQNLRSLTSAWHETKKRELQHRGTPEFAKERERDAE